MTGLICALILSLIILSYLILKLLNGSNNANIEINNPYESRLIRLEVDKMDRDKRTNDKIIELLIQSNSHLEAIRIARWCVNLVFADDNNEKHHINLNLKGEQSKENAIEAALKAIKDNGDFKGMKLHSITCNRKYKS